MVFFFKEKPLLRANLLLIFLVKLVMMIYLIVGFVIQVSDDDYSANAGMFDSNVDSVCLLLVWINMYCSRT